MVHWLKFNAVGVLGFALQTATLFLLTHGAHALPYMAATGIAVELAVLNNFVWHQRWTWRDRPSGSVAETLARLLKFNLSNGLVSLAGNLLFMSLLVGQLHLNITGSNLISVALCSLVNFLLADRFAFQRQRAPTTTAVANTSTSAEF